MRLRFKKHSNGTYEILIFRMKRQEWVIYDLNTKDQLYIYVDRFKELEIYEI